MLCNLPRTNEKIFANVEHVKANFFLQKGALAKEVNSNLLLIYFQTFRHWEGNHKQHRIKDSWHVKMILYHKRIGSAEKYVHLEEMIYEETIDRFTDRVADTMEEAIKLVKVGF